MGVDNCCSAQSQTIENFDVIYVGDDSSVECNFQYINILDYEERVKQYAQPENKGFINQI